MDIVERLYISVETLTNSQLKQCASIINKELFTRLQDDKEEYLETSDEDNGKEEYLETSDEDNGKEEYLETNEQDLCDNKLVTPITILTRDYFYSKSIMQVLENYNPSAVDKDTFIQQAYLLLDLMSITPDIKIHIIRYLLKLVNANLWVMENPRIRKILSTQIVDFETDPNEEAQQIASEYKWIHDFPNTCSGRGIATIISEYP